MNKNSVNRDPDIAPGFLQAASSELVESCISRFIDRTNNATMEMSVCVVCAREMFCVQVKEMLVDDIPNCNLLAPFKHHQACVLTNGMLLHWLALKQSTTGVRGNVCENCMSNLQKKRLSCLALVNGMWTGELPSQLAILTVPEQYLIPRHFSAAYIMKMYPKQKGTKSLNNGLRGNMSTYRLDTNEITELVSDDVYPWPVKILASTIRVTFVGLQNVPKRCYPGFLRVQRQKVCEALVWLKANNSLYEKIVICEKRLEELVQDGIPTEILSTMRYSDDIEAVDRERVGFFPDDEDFYDQEYVRNAAGT
jgi:hypothetical protein